jgi:hypothetical protein
MKDNRVLKAGENNRIRIGVIVAVILAFIIWWFLAFFYTAHGFQSVALRPGESTFIAPFDHMFFAAFCNEDISLKEELDAEPSHIDIKLQDEAGATLYEAGIDVIIHTDGFTNMDLDYMPKMPVNLERNKEYTFICSCVSAKGTPVTDLSIIVYGDEADVRGLTLSWFLAGAALLGLLIWYAGRENFPIASYAIMLVLALTLTICYLPATENTSSKTAYANIYSASSSLLKRRTVDENGYAYIEEDAIRDDGYIFFGDPYWRFFADTPEREHARTEGLTSVNYSLDKKSFSPLQYPAVLAVTAARKLDAPYQVVRLIASAVNAFISAVLMLIAYHLITNRAQKQFLILFSLLPSVTLSFARESGFGIFLSLCCVTLAICSRKNTNRIILIISAVTALVYPVWSVLRISGYPLKEGIQMLFTRYDDFLMESIAGDARFSKTAVFTGLAFLLFFLFKASTDRANATKRPISILWLIPTSAGLLLYAGLTVSALSSICGTVLLPLYLIPYRWKNEGSLLSDHKSLMVSLYAYCISVIYLTRIAVL